MLEPSAKDVGNHQFVQADGFARLLHQEVVAIHRLLLLRNADLSAKISRLQGLDVAVKEDAIDVRTYRHALARVHPPRAEIRVGQVVSLNAIANELGVAIRIPKHRSRDLRQLLVSSIAAVVDHHVAVVEDLRRWVDCLDSPSSLECPRFD